jgi:hypothetical protein
MDSTLNNGELNTNSDSSNQVVQPNSFDPQKFEERILKLVDEKISDPRLAQSIKDKGISEMKKSKDFRDIFKEIQTMKESGMTDKEIELEARIREVEERESRIASNSPGKTVESNQADVVRLTVKAFDLDLNDPEVIVAINDSDVEKSIRNLKAVSERKRASVSPGIVAQSAGDNARQPDLLADYQQKAKGVYGSALIDLKMEYRKKGLDIN